MCGIGAMSRATPSAIPDGVLALRLMALELEDRGQDATGFAWTTRDNPWPYFWKDDERASEAAWRAPLEMYTRTAIAHTRFATQGTPSDLVNNHPIVLPGIVLVHNGIVTNDDEVFDMLNVEREGACDSEAIAALLTYGADVLGEESPAVLLELVEGDAALAWIRTGDSDVLHLARLRERPLIIGWTPAGDMLAASTYSAMREAACGTTIANWEVVPEGTYMQVRGGEIVHSERINLPARVKRYSTTTYAPRGTTTYVAPGDRDRFTTTSGATYVQGADGSYRLQDEYDEFGVSHADVEAWWQQHADDEAIARDGVELYRDAAISLEAERKRRRGDRKPSERGTGGELVAIGTGSPKRTFTSELSAPVDGLKGS